jgi:hypothetical protein
MKHKKFNNFSRIKWRKQHENVFLLSGTDRLVHCYIHERGAKRYLEVPNELNPFPELSDLPSSAVSIDICETKRFRIVAVGCQNGCLRLLIIKEGVQTISKTLFLEGPISSLCLFRARGPKSHAKTGLTNVIMQGANFDHNFHPLVKKVNSSVISFKKNKNIEKYKNERNIMRAMNLVVGEAIGRVILFRYQTSYC